MTNSTTDGLDLAKNMVQLHRTDASGRAMLRHRLWPTQVPECLICLPYCPVSMETCGGGGMGDPKID